MPSKVTETAPRGAFPSSSFKYTPLQHVRVLFVRFVQGLFYAAPPGAFHWEPDLESTELVITDENPINTNTIGKRPAVSFTRGPAGFYSLGLDDMMELDLKTDTKTKSVLVPGTMAINCCSRNDLETEQLAFIIGENLWLHREMLMRAGFFEIGRQPQISAVSPAGSLVSGDSATEWYVTTITCPFQFYRTSQTTPLNRQIANNIQMFLRTGVLPVDAQGNTGPALVDPSSSHEVLGQVDTSLPPSFAPSASDARGGTPNPGETADELPRVPHPLNPAVLVTVRSVRPNRPGLRPPSIGGRVLPLSQERVEESQSSATDTRTVKV